MNNRPNIPTNGLILKYENNDVLLLSYGEYFVPDGLVSRWLINPEPKIPISILTVTSFLTPSL
jgi:hypothetical protein